MADALTFMRSYANNMQVLVNTLTALQTQNLQITEDPTLVTRYFSSSGARTDINAQDVANGQSAIVQVLFAYNSGSPTQSTFILKMLP